MADRDPVELLASLNEAVRENTLEVRGLRADLERVYGRDAAGRLLAVPPNNGEPAPMPKPAWTPRDVTNIVDRFFPKPKRRR